MTPAQRGTLAKIHRVESLEGVQARTLDTLIQRGYANRTDTGWTLTKRGLRIATGRAGGNLPEVRKKDLRAHFKTKKPAKAKRDRAATAREKKEHLTGLEKHIKQAEKKRGMALQRILGPSGVTSAVKVAKASGDPFTARDVQALRSGGWGVAAAGTVTARPGTSGIAGVQFAESDWEFRNPDTLGPNGTARALILLGHIDAAAVDDLSAHGYDVTPAPKKVREATRNPAPAPLQKKVFDAMKASAKKNTALRVDELAEKIKAKVEDVAQAIQNLASMGLAHEAGRDLLGPCWLPGAPSRGLFDNPSPRARAEKKARAWYGEEGLVTAAQEIDWTPPESAVHIGQMVAIEYLSDKFDGTKRIYRHDVTKVRQMLLSPDGSTIIIDPPFKITKRGIEG